MYSLAIFDMDGVLVNSEATFKRACADALHRWGVYPEYDEFTPYTGMGDTLYIGEVARAHGAEFTFDMVDEAYRLYGEYAAQTLKVFPWSQPVLEGLHAAGVPLCVASSAGRFKVDTNLRCIGVDPSIFKCVITGDMVEKKKPAPDIFLAAADKCGAEAGKCLVFEDALSGVRAAKTAGMTACAVTTSFDREKLLSVGADFVFDGLSDAANNLFGVCIK